MITEARRRALRKYKKSPRGREVNRAYMRRRNRRFRLSCLQKYSDAEIPFCACCAEFNLEFLVLDHITGGGNAHRRAIGVSSGDHFYRWIIKNKFPYGFRVLCQNCNSALGNYGYCPHEV